MHLVNDEDKNCWYFRYTDRISSTLLSQLYRFGWHAANQEEIDRMRQVVQESKQYELYDREHRLEDAFFEEVFERKMKNFPWILGIN